MPYAKDSYTGDGATTDFVISFPYINSAHVGIKVDGVLQVIVDDYVLTDAATIRFNTAPSSGAIVLLVRSTSQTARLVDYQSGSILSEEVLDTDSLQAFYLTQEVWDIAEEGSVAVGTTTTSAPGGSASVVNAGTSTNAVLNFTIPSGPTGPTGATGATGATGPSGTNGTNGTSGIITQLASQAEAEAGTNNTKGMTPLRTSQAIAAFGDLETVVATDFVGTDGYIKYGSGLIVQWGYAPDTGSYMTIVYPTPFTTKVFSVQTTMVGAGANYQNMVVKSDYFTQLSQFTMWWDSAPTGVTWVAIGI